MIEIKDANLEERIARHVERTGAADVNEAIARLIDVQEEHDRWLVEQRRWIDAKIRRGLQQLDRGDGIPENQLDAYLARLKSQEE